MGEEKSLCVVEYFGASNQGVGEAIGPAREMVKAGKANELGQFVVSCERCGADFALSAEVGSPIEMQLLTAPEPSEESCAAAASRQEGDWVMNLNGRAWFPVDAMLDTLNQEEKSATDQESEEQQFTPAELLEKFETIGKKAEDRYAADYLHKPNHRNHELPDHGFDGIFALESGGRAKFHWIVSPTFYRPERRLPGGSLVTKHDKDDGIEVTESYMFNRILEGGRASIKIKHETYMRSEEHGEQLMAATNSLAEDDPIDQDKLRQIHETLAEIEQAIDYPEQVIGWHQYGRSYIW